MYKVQLKLPAGLAEAASNLLELGEHQIVQREDAETGEVWLEVFLTSREEADREAGHLAEILDMLGGPSAVAAEVIEQPDRDWKEAWKEHFHCMQVSPRVTVCPSWEEATAAEDGVIIQLDPGMSFGTGQHATTQACLRFLDELSADNCAGGLCDVGCGSGIVSIAGALLGFDPVLAFDHEPDAVRIARENCAANGAGSVDVRHMDLAGAAVHELPRARVVIANMLAHLLEAFAPVIVDRLAPEPEARLVLAGMAGEAQYAWTRGVYERLGLRCCEVRRDGEWVSLLLQRCPVHEAGKP